MWNKVLFPDIVTNYDAGEYMYYGPMENGKPNGIGIAIYPKNDKMKRLYYYGNFTDGQRVDSAAIMFYKDGSYFRGSMNNDKWFKGIFFDVEKSILSVNLIMENHGMVLGISMFLFKNN